MLVAFAGAVCREKRVSEESRREERSGGTKKGTYQRAMN